jgi:outer membrane receptor protein involved in Fe transport
MRSNSSRFAAVSTAAIILAGLSSPAAAQTTAPSSSPPSEVDTAEDADAIVVTARRREETLQDIPGSITALTGEQIQNLVVDGNQDYLRQVPGASLVTSGPDYLNDFSLRGQGSGRLGFSETATGIFKDGHYNAGGGFGGRSFSRLDTFDVDRIEVLRGPQGALYGRNSVGGAVNILTNTPSDDFEVRGRLYYDDVERGIVEGIVNLPIGTNLAVRIGGFYDDQNSGHIFNETTDDFVDQQRFIGTRAALRARPTDALTLDLSYEYYDARTPGFASLGYKANAPANLGGFELDPEPYIRRFLDRVGFTEVQEHTIYGRAVWETGIGDLSLGSIIAAGTQREPMTTWIISLASAASRSMVSSSTWKATSPRFRAHRRRTVPDRRVRQPQLAARSRSAVLHRQPSTPAPTVRSMRVPAPPRWSRDAIPDPP